MRPFEEEHFRASGEPNAMHLIGCHLVGFTRSEFGCLVLPPQRSAVFWDDFVSAQPTVDGIERRCPVLITILARFAGRPDDVSNRTGQDSALKSESMVVSSDVLLMIALALKQADQSLWTWPADQPGSETRNGVVTNWRMLHVLEHRHVEGFGIHGFIIQEPRWEDND